MRERLGSLRVNATADLTKRRQIYMSDRAWKKLEALSERLRWTRSRTFDFILAKMIKEEVRIEQVIETGQKTGMQKPKTDRVQKGVFFLPGPNEFLERRVRKELGFSMSNFLEQIILHEDMLRLYGFYDELNDEKDFVLEKEEKELIQEFNFEEPKLATA